MSQTQSEYGAESLCDISDGKDSHIATNIKDSDQNDIDTHVHTVFNQSDDYLVADL